MQFAMSKNDFFLISDVLTTSNSILFNPYLLSVGLRKSNTTYQPCQEDDYERESKIN